MKSFFCLLVALYLAAMPSVCAQDLPPLQKKAAKLMRSGHLLSSAEMEAILGTERAEVLDLLRKVVRSEVTEWADGSQLFPPTARRVLLQLPDTEVLESIGNQLAEYQLFGPYGTVSDGLAATALQSKQPKLLPYFAKSVFRDEDVNVRDFVWQRGTKINRSIDSFSNMLSLTYEIEDFSPQVRAWARAMLTANHLPLSERRELGRAWWKENEKAILAGNYAAVRPGISPAQGMPTGPASTLPDPGDAKRVSPNDRSVTATKSSNDSPISGLPKAAEGAAPRSSLWPLWSLLSAVLAAAGWLFLRGRRTRQ
jgi:hypothetical protein